MIAEVALRLMPQQMKSQATRVRLATDEKAADTSTHQRMRRTQSSDPETRARSRAHPNDQAILPRPSGRHRKIGDGL